MGGPKCKLSEGCFYERHFLQLWCTMTIDECNFFCSDVMYTRNKDFCIGRK